MILNFDKELNDKRTYEYNISNTSERMFTLIEILLGIDWNMKADLINRSTRVSISCDNECGRYRNKYNSVFCGRLKRYT